MAETDPPFLADIDETCEQPIREQLEQRLEYLPRTEQLNSIVELFQIGADTNEQVIEVMAEAWDFLQRRVLWDVRYSSLNELKREIGFEDGIKHVLARHHAVEARIQAACKGIRQRWGGYLPELLADIAPPRFTRHVVDKLYRLSKTCSLDRAREMLKTMIQTRLKAAKTSKHPWITQADVTNVIKQLAPSSLKRLRDVGDNTSQCSGLDSPRQCLIPESTSEDISTAALVLGNMNVAADAQPPSVFRFEVPGSIDDDYLQNEVEEPTKRSKTSLSRPKDLQEMPTVQATRRADDFADDNVYLHSMIPQAEFRYDSARVLNRLIQKDEYDLWQRSGRLRAKDVFRYFDQSAFLEMVHVEFNMYHYHHRSLPDIKGFNLLRNMYFSLFQQMIRMDPVLYALNCSLRPDKQWRLIVYPDIASDANPAGAFAALYKDTQFQPSLLSSTIRVSGRTGDGGDREPNEPGLRLDIAPASSMDETGIHAPEMWLFGWHVSISEDHRFLEEQDNLLWEQVAASHRDLEAPAISINGRSPTFGRPRRRFLGSIILDHCSALGDALTGHRKWTDPQVIRERNILLGSDDEAAARYVIEVRKRMVDNFRKAFEVMKDIEITAFGGLSFFASIGTPD